MGTGSFPGVKCDRGVLLTTHPLLVPQSWKSRAIPLPTLWATRNGITLPLPVISRVQWGGFRNTYECRFPLISLHNSFHLVHERSCGVHVHFALHACVQSVCISVLQCDLLPLQVMIYVVIQFKFCNHTVPTPLSSRSRAWVCSRSLAGIAGSNPAGDMEACRECCVLSGRDLCVRLITSPEESY